MGKSVAAPMKREEIDELVVSAIKDDSDNVVAKTVPAAAPKKEESIEESTDEDEFCSDVDELASKVAVKRTSDSSKEDGGVANKLPAAAPKKGESSEVSTDEDEFNSDVDETAQPKKAHQAVKRASDSFEGDVVVAKNVPAAAPITPLVPASKKEESIEESTVKDAFISDADELPSKFADHESEDDAELQKKEIKPAATPSKTSSEEKDDKMVDAHVELPSKVSDDESEDDSAESDDEEPRKKKMKLAGTPAATKAPKEDTSSEKKSSEEEEKDADAEMVDAATPVTPKVQTSGSKTLYVGNLAFSIEQEDIVNFFKDAGEVQDLRFALHPDGAFKGFGHVEFVTAEAAHKALELNGEQLLGRPVRLDLARERREYTPNSGREANSHQRPARSEGTTVYVRGFDKNEEEDKIRSTLEEHFSSCGEIIKTNIPTEPDGSFKGMAYIEFTNGDALNKALKLDQSELGGYNLTVQMPRPRRDSSGRDRGFGGRSSGRGGRGRRGGHDGGGHFGSGGRFGGGDRFASGDRGRGNTPSFTRDD